MPEIMEPTNGIPAQKLNDLTITPSITMTAPQDSLPEPEAGLFTDDLISPTIAATLPPTYVLRPLRKSDYAIGFLDVLRVLTTVGDITEKEWNGRYDWMNNQGKGGYYIMVIEDQGKIVGTGALLVERKLYVPLVAPLAIAGTSANCPLLQHPSPRTRRPHRRYCSCKRSAREETRSQAHSGP